LQKYLEKLLRVSRISFCLFERRRSAKSLTIEAFAAEREGGIETEEAGRNTIMVSCSLPNEMGSGIQFLQGSRCRIPGAKS
jgi:hypothetical protein